MKSEFVWFFGPSAVGKQTIIQNLQDHKNLLRARLKLNEKIEVMEPSLEEDRTKIMDHILSLREPQIVSSVLIKGQGDDLAKKLPQQLRDRIPSARHRIVFLYCDPKELSRRWQLRWEQTNNPIWKDRAPEDCKGEMIGILYQIKKLRSDVFELTCFDNSEGQYKPMDCQSV